MIDNRSMFVSHEYVHYSYANIIYSLGLYITNYIMPFKSWTVSTFHKQIQAMKQENSTNIEPPSFTLDPTLSIEIDDSSLQHWRFPQRYGTRPHLFEPLIKTDDIIIEPLFLTINLDIEFNGIFNSVYQKLDFDTQLLLHFGGLNRLTDIYYIEYDLPFPNSLQQYDLSKFGFAKKVIKTLGKELYVFPIITKPLFQLTSISDGSEKYGGDRLPSWTTNATIRLSFHLFTGFTYKSNWKLEDLNIDIKLENPNVNFVELIGHSNKVGENDLKQTYITFDIFEVPTGSTRLVFESDNDYTEDEWFSIDLSNYTFNEIFYILPKDHEIDFDDNSKILRVKGPLYKGQHIHIAIK